MKLASKICHYLLYLIGIFFIVMSFDVFISEDAFIDKLVGFFMNSIPGLVIIILNFVLRKKELIFGVILIIAAIFFMFFFKYYRDIRENILNILTVVVPTLVCGIIFVITRNRYN